MLILNKKSSNLSILPFQGYFFLQNTNYCENDVFFTDNIRADWGVFMCDLWANFNIFWGKFIITIILQRFHLFFSVH